MLEALSEIIFFIGLMGFSFIPSIYVYFDAKSRGSCVWYFLLPLFLGWIGIIGWFIGRPKKLNKNKDAKKFKKIKNYTIVALLVSIILFIGGIAGMSVNEDTYTGDQLETPEEFQPIIVQEIVQIPFSNYTSAEKTAFCKEACVDEGWEFVKWNVNEEANELECFCDNGDPDYWQVLKYGY